MKNDQMISSYIKQMESQRKISMDSKIKLGKADIVFINHPINIWSDKIKSDKNKHGIYNKEFVEYKDYSKIKGKEMTLDSLKNTLFAKRIISELNINIEALYKITQGEAILQWDKELEATSAFIPAGNFAQNKDYNLLFLKTMREIRESNQFGYGLVKWDGSGFKKLNDLRMRIKAIKDLKLVDNIFEENNNYEGFGALNHTDIVLLILQFEEMIDELSYNYSIGNIDERFLIYFERLEKALNKGKDEEAVVKILRPLFNKEHNNRTVK